MTGDSSLATHARMLQHHIAATASSAAGPTGPRTGVTATAPNTAAATAATAAAAAVSTPTLRGPVPLAFEPGGGSGTARSAEQRETLAVLCGLVALAAAVVLVGGQVVRHGGLAAVLDVRARAVPSSFGAPTAKAAAEEEEVAAARPTL